MILENSAKAICHKQQSINYQLIKLHNKWFFIGFYSAKRGKKLLVSIEIFLSTVVLGGYFPTVSLHILVYATRQNLSFYLAA